MPGKKLIIALACSFYMAAGYAQSSTADTIPLVDQDLAIDTSMDYDDLLDELGSFLDSILAPRSYFLASASLSNGYFNYKRNTGVLTEKQTILSPVVGYYHKSGPGISLAGSIAKDGVKNRLYQYSITPSFDFIQSRRWIGGFSYTRYITKDSLSFYTSPLQNEIAGYYLWRKAWLQPGLVMSMGWGSRTDLKKREEFIKRIYRRQNDLVRRLRRNLITPRIDTVAYTTKVEESVKDFSLSISVRHSFYWLEVSKHHDYFKFTPIFSFTAGTQKFGSNRTTSATFSGKATNLQFTRGDVNLDDELKFQPLSLTLYLRPEYSIGKFFIQPQFIVDYYFPAEENNFTTLFTINAGFMF